MTNKINTKHPDYNKMTAKWTRCETVLKGEDEVKEAGTVYLPSLKGQEDSDYSAYKARACFYPASSRTVDGLVGIAMRKPPSVINWPTNKLAYYDSVTPDRLAFASFVKSVFKKVVGVGRNGVLLDYGEVSGPNDFPLMVEYVAKSIINWATRINPETGLEEAILVVLEEVELLPDTDNSYKLVEHITYRELLLDDNGNYAYRIWIKRSDGEYMAGDFKYPLVSGKKLDFIPFIVFGPDGPGFKVSDPPILNIVNVNLSHYRNSADLEHGRHYTALPTPWAAGFKTDKSTTLYIGSPYAWVSENPAANASFLEYTGAGLTTLERALEEKEGQMAILGARMLEEQKRAVEATDTHKLRHSGEQSVLSSLAESVESGFNIILNWVSELTRSSISDGKIVELNKDFNVEALSPEQMAGLLAAMQGSAISYDTYFYNLKRGEVYPDDRTLEQEQDLISMQSPELDDDENLDLDKEE